MAIGRKPQANGGKVTLAHIAQAAGCGVSTVSVVLRDQGEKYAVTAETQRRILDAAARLGYVPDHVATTLSTGRTHTVAIASRAYRFPDRDLLQHTIALELKRHGMRVVMYDFYWGDDDAQLLREIASTRPEGIVLGRVAQPEAIDVAAGIARRGVPLVCADFVDGVPVDQIGLNRHETGRLPCARLLELGHRRIGNLLPWSSPAREIQERLAGYEDAYRERGLAPPQGGCFWRQGETEYESGYEGMRQCWESGQGCTAVMTLNDRAAVGALRFCAERGVAAPAQVSIFGAQDLPEAQYSAPPLTTLRYDYPSWAATCARFLMERIGGEARQPRRAEAPMRIVERASTGAPAEP